MYFEFCNGQELRKKNPAWTLVFSRFGRRRKWHGTHNYKPEGQWNTTADVMVDNIKDSGHPVFRAASALNRGFLKRKGGECTIPFSAGASNAELLLRTTNPGNQPSIHGATADWRDEFGNGGHCSCWCDVLDHRRHIIDHRSWC